MAGKSYKQLYEETKGMLAKYQDEVVPALREKAQPITEEEILALKAVVYGCNTNSMLRGGLHNGMRFEDAIIIVDKLIARLSV